MRVLASLALLMLPAAASVAQTFPAPDASNPRIQSVHWSQGQPIVLTALPASTLTVMLEPGEAINRAMLSTSRGWDVSVPTERNTLQITPQADAGPATLSVDTDQRSYEFVLETGEGLMAAYLVRLEYGPTIEARATTEALAPEGLTWGYRLRGDREVRPQSVRDNGEKTVITYGPDQALPAVFAIGPTGDEEVVNGHMRGDVFVIDRVHEELVFRINRDKATARRNKREDGAS
ncbi:TrbG/VirB9 family P-type conjugative transfer protein [Erythrobacter sp. SCSIO 43205]|uniref:TrbG/VirB9 family P-type conjugative transfer protein n=1 Tax=Erythrobacter sp. SCSIO 43205 TaxID=2779361 RepID=UPI001CA95864|nr:TrbG/VirB9 family P-type conjugative transfer protein [Erythrobacter sp. SCSIO 43205]UAB79220.1 TrbG/VirB9 family P-type conjugative transfer protein [Erythrobacter sp. SCSIO 43205]